MAYTERKLRSPRYIIRRGGRLALLSLAVILVVSLAAWGCSTSTPERTVGDFIKARMSGNECKAAGLTVEEDLEGFLGNENLLNSSGVVFDLETTEVDTTHATVMVHYRWDGEVVDLPYVCERVGTKWRVALRETEELWFEEPS